MLTKICSKCKKRKSVDLFSKRKRNIDGFHGQCKSCKNSYQHKYQQTEKWKLYQKKWRRSEKGRLSERNSYFKNKYNITLNDYNRMSKEQKGVCAICGKKETHKNQFNIKRLAVDHDHKTGKVRGLLCIKCNTLLKALEENGFIKKAQKYLKTHQE